MLMSLGDAVNPSNVGGYTGDPSLLPPCGGSACVPTFYQATDLTSSNFCKEVSAQSAAGVTYQAVPYACAPTAVTWIIGGAMALVLFIAVK